MLYYRSGGDQSVAQLIGIFGAGLLSMRTKAALKKSAAKIDPEPTLGKPRRKSAPNASQFVRVRTRRVFEEICDQVRRQMSSGALRPGDKLPAERELAVEFGVSRTAVREALRSLEIAGIVGLQKGVKGGAFILKGDLELITRSMSDMFYLGRISLDSLTETRTLVMGAAVGLVSRRITPELLAAMEQNVEKLASLPRLSSATKRIEISADFYDLVAEATGNELLQVIVQSLSSLVLQRVEARQMNAMPDLLAHRKRLVESFAKHDVEGAQREIVKHLQSLHKHLLRQEGRDERLPVSLARIQRPRSS
jgi:DNA-binding FadR family transcriptional regulator